MDYRAVTDEALAERCKLELPDVHIAFDEIIHRYENYVMKLAYRVLWNYSDAEEATQEVFVKLFNKIHLFKGRSSFKTWFYRFTLNIAIRLQQKRSRYEDRVGEYAKEKDIKGEGPIEPDIFVQVRNALNSLIIKDKEVIMLKFYSELSFVEMAKVLDIGESAVKMRYYRAMKLMEEHFPKKQHDQD